MTKQAKRQGFTLVELVVTISIIALLATLTVVAYGTWRAETVRTKLKSDLINARTAMEDVRNFNAAYPTSAASTFTASKGVTISGGSTNGTTYCIGASSLEAGYQIRYRLTNTIRDPIEGTC